MNEDFVVAGPDWVVVLDGATARPGVDSGCRHDPAWLVRRLGGALAGRLAAGAAGAAGAGGGGEPLSELLAGAIEMVCAAHAGTCDLDNPDSPSATVAMLRRRGDALDWLVLADSPVLVDTGEVLVLRDGRVDRLPSYTVEAVRAARNSPGGFWVASTRPEAAYEALGGALPLKEVRRAAVLSDGASRLVERFAVLGWPDLLDLLDRDGPAEVIRRTREAEAAEEQAGERGKRYDDATAVMVRF
ncbi:protein phosphatase 2C domain-containing protein [Spirillospora sp. NBC_01491]|uniref:protein phosphatase 2C domain-containing protein n=1 Tax=Spirillospora sp. NBC_01491 TaxID=2976007 RepID=UPI002E34B335|nr:protein phosphatase 2C domain-containing protein [Spirillospora sp. NBC_01491]